MVDESRLDQLHRLAVEFDKEHPEVWEMFVFFTFDRMKLGFQHYSADAIFHRIRWETAKPEYEKGAEFKLNDHYTAFYARWFHNSYPEHDGFFRTREQKSEQRPPSNVTHIRPDALQ